MRNTNQGSWGSWEFTSLEGKVGSLHKFTYETSGCY